ncbi:MAG: AraC family transcriptional regulator, partial [Clostridia bacterium]|nr:AraC family transcriptional regulator [Clostridia bacterium]
DTSGIAGRFEALFREVEEEPEGFFLKLQILIADIVTELFRMVVSSQGIRCACGAPVKSVDAFRAERLVRFVEENYQRDISLADAAGILFLSPRQINRLMKKELSCTFHDYLLRYRLAVAVRLLKEGSLSIEAAAYRAGFSSHYYMYQVFRHFGMETPGQIQLGQNR